MTLTKIEKVVIVVGIILLVIMIWGAIAGRKHKEALANAPVSAAAIVAAPSQPSPWLFPFFIGYMLSGGGSSSGYTSYPVSSSSNFTPSGSSSSSGFWGSDDSTSSDSGSWGSSDDSGSWGSDDSSSSWGGGSESGSFGSDE